MRKTGPARGGTLVVCLPNSLDHYYATIAGWKLGALVVPLRYDIPEREALKILAVAELTLVVSERLFPNYACFECRRLSEGGPGGALPDVTLDVRLTPAKSQRVRLP